MQKKRAESMSCVWFAISDARRCRLLHCQRTPTGTPHVEEACVLRNEFPEHEHGRPLALAGMTGHSYAAAHHDEEERDRRFASQIIAWLDDQRQQRKFDRLTIWATPRMLGALRRVPIRSLVARLDKFVGNLMRLKSGELADHPLVRDLVESEISD